MIKDMFNAEAAEIDGLDLRANPELTRLAMLLGQEPSNEAQKNEKLGLLQGLVDYLQHFQEDEDTYRGIKTNLVKFNHNKDSTSSILEALTKSEKVDAQNLLAEEAA